MNWDPLWLSYKVAVPATLMAVVLGVAAAAFLSRAKFWGKGALCAVMSLPLVMPPSVLGYYLLVSLGSKSGIGQFYYELFGKSLLFSYTGCVIASWIGSLPLVFRAVYAGLQQVDQNYVRAAETLGASRLRIFFTIELPLAKRAVWAGATLGFARSLGDFGATLMVAGDIPGETQTASLYIYDQIYASHSAQAHGMIAVLSATAVLALWLTERWTRTEKSDA